MLIGVPNFLSVFGILHGLQSISFTERSAVFYTILGGTVIVTLFLGGVFFWGEKARPRQYIGIVAAVLAIALLNLS